MTTDIDAVARLQAIKAVLSTVKPSFIRGEHLSAFNQIAALASAQPAQAGEYEGLAKRLDTAAILNVYEDDIREAASAIRTLEARVKALEAQLLASEQRFGTLRAAYDRERQRPIQIYGSEAAEARAAFAEQRLARYGEALQEVKARTYSNDRSCALKDDAVAEICDIARAALSEASP